MNAIEIRNLSKSFRGMYAVDHLSMTVPQGAHRVPRVLPRSDGLGEHDAPSRQSPHFRSRGGGDP